MNRVRCADAHPRLVALAFVAFAVLGTRTANAEPPTAAPVAGPDASACADAFEEGQRARRDGAFTRARDLLLTCSREPCSEALRPTCTAWLAELELRMPSIVVSLRSAVGEDVRDARVLVDGVPRAERLDGRALEVDPGERVVRVEARGSTLEKRLVVAEGEKSRLLALRLEGRAPPPPPPPPPASPRPVPVATWLLGGVALASAGVSTGFWIAGDGGYTDMERCRPRCSPELVSDTRTQLVLGDLAMIVAGLAAGAGVITWLAR